MNVLALDPLFLDGVGVSEVLIVLVKVVVAFAVLLVAVMFMVWFERKFISDMQNRIGPNVAGPWGLFQTLADGIKLFFKEDLIPDRADRFVFRLAPLLALVPAFLVFVVVPIGGDFTGDGDGVVTWWGHDTFLQIADAPVGILFFLAMSSIAVYGVMLAGWSSGSKYPLLGAVRASAQMVSYEAALGLSLATVLLKSGSLSSHDIVQGQAGGFGLGDLADWNVAATGFVPFFVFLVAATAELNRPPFDLVEAEQELVGGFNTEYSSLRFALFFLAEYMNAVTMSAIIVTLFFGGPAGPAPVGPAWLWGLLWFTAKLLVFLGVFVWFRASLPRLRYDQLMDLGWKFMIPLALGWFLFVAALDLGADRGWSRWAILAVAVPSMVAAMGLLAGAISAAKRSRLAEREGVV